MSTSKIAEVESPSVARVRAEAERLGLAIRPVRLDDSTRTAEQAAIACGCGVDQIVKSIIFRVAGNDRHVLFLTAGGLVMEMGGPNSHGAVVAREHGIPAVVGVPDATSLIVTGHSVTVDGAAGTVRQDRPDQSAGEG